MPVPTGFLASDKDLLIRVVKDCQKSKVQGTKGSWKDYIKAQESALGKVDPTMHSWKVGTMVCNADPFRCSNAEKMSLCRRLLVLWQP